MSSKENSPKKIKATLNKKFGHSREDRKSHKPRFSPAGNSDIPAEVPEKTYGSKRGQLERELRAKKQEELEASQAGDGSEVSTEPAAEREAGADRGRFRIEGKPRFGGDREDRGRFRNEGKPRFGGDREARGRFRKEGKPRLGGDRDDRGRFRNEGKPRFGGDKGAPRREERPWMRSRPDNRQKSDTPNPPWLRRVLRLTTEKGREKTENFLAEGVRCVQEIVQHHAEIVREIFVVDSFAGTELLQAITDRQIQIQTISTAEMELISTMVTNQGIIAICRSASVKPDYDMARFLTLVDGIQDPGNLGSVYRTSLGFASDGLLLGKGTVSAFNPKVVRGSSGTFLRVPFEQGVDMQERIMFLRQKGFTVIATDLHAKQDLADIAPYKLRKVALLIGNEGSGADIAHIQHADEIIKIPMEQNLESLNVAVAHGILSFQIKEALKTGG